MLAAILTMAILLSCVPGTAFAANHTERPLQPFTDAGVSDETREQNVFYFGSTNLIVSEKSTASYLLKIGRGGAAEEEASVTVKFGNYSAVYGENYTVDLYEGDGELTLNPDSLSVVDFLTENADSCTEMSTEEAKAAEAEALAQFVSQGETDLYDVNGRKISTIHTTESEPDENGDTSYEIENEDVANSNDFDSNLSDYATAAQVRLTFAKGETEKYIVVTPWYSEEAQGDTQAEITLDNPSEGMYLPDEDFITFLTIEDTDEVVPARLNITDSVLSADGESVTLTITRSGAINRMVGAKMTTSEISAVTGDDFQGVNAMLYFPMGVTKRTVTLQLNHRYGDKSVQFKVELNDPVNAEIDNGSCLVTILPADSTAETAGYSLQWNNPKVGIGWESNAYNFVEHGYTLDNKAWLTSETTFQSDNRGKDCPYYTWCGVYFDIPKYSYTGMAVNWSVGRDGYTWGESQISYRDPENNFYKIYGKDTGDFSNDWDSGLFDKAVDTCRGYVGVMTSRSHGKYLTVHSVHMSHMLYTIHLMQADPLAFTGVSSAEEESYVATLINGNALEDDTMDIFSGAQITIKAPDDGKNYTALTGLQVVDKKGNLLYNVTDIDPDAVIFQNGSAATLTLTEKLLNDIGDKLNELGLYKKVDERWVGEMYIKPVFSYKDAVVTFRSLDEGSAYFEGYENKTVTMHIGDVITFSEDASASSGSAGGETFKLATVVGDAKFHAVGYDADCYKSAETGTVSKRSHGEKFSNGICSLRIEDARTIVYPRVSAIDNQVVVRVEKSLVDSGAFDTKQGLFLGECTASDVYYNYTLSDTRNKLSSDELFTVVAVPTDNTTVANWTLGKDSVVYSGNTMYLYTGNKAQDNLLTLSLAENASSYTIKGITYNDTNVLKTNATSSVTIPATGAVLAAGTSSAASDMETGEFRLEDVAASPDTTVPVLVYYNNSTNILPVKVGNSDTVNLSAVTLSTNNADTARVSNVFFELGGREMSSAYGIGITGDKLVMRAEVKDGNTYTVYQNEKRVEKVETVTAVNFLVLDGRTHQIKSVHEAKKTDVDVWEASILKFNPESPEEYYYGDLFYVQIVTDRVSDVLKETGKTAETVYAPVATAYSIAAGSEYTPTTINYTAPFSADTVMGDGLQGTKSFAKLPLVGNLDLFSIFAGNIKIGSIGQDAYDSYEDDYDQDIESGDNSQASSPYVGKVAVRITIYTQTLSDGRLRLHIGVAFSVGNSKFRNLQNPFETASYAYDAVKTAKGSPAGYSAKTGGAGINVQNMLMDNNNLTGESNANAMMSNLSGLQMSFSMAFGLYMDFVAVADDGKIENFYFVGVGGYIGVSAGVSYIAYFILPLVYIPAYLGFSATVSVAGYMGGTQNIDQYLLSSDDFLDQKEIVIDKSMVKTIDAQISASVTGFAGVGVCNVIGVRVNLTLGLDFTYVQRMSEWYPNLKDNWGFTSTLTLGGQVDLLVTSVKFEGLSVPLTSQGFDKYFTALARALKMKKLVDNAYSGIEQCTDSELVARYNTVKQDIDSKAATAETMTKDAYSLYAYLHDHPGLVGKAASTIYMMYYTDSDVYSFLAENTEAAEFTVKQPVDSEWLGDVPMDRAGYQEAFTDTLVKNGYDNPGTQLLSLGDGRMIMFFLADPSALGNPSWSDANQTSVLVYSVFNGMTWSKPVAVENSATNDYYPNVVSCGDKLMISWISIPDGSGALSESDYTKEEVVDLYTAMEVFTTMYDIGSGTFSEVEQLTDDDFMDICPQGVYDSTTGDCAVYYIKSAVDDEVPAADMSLTDFFNFYSETTYSMVCYRLYDSASDTWVIDYYENEMADGMTQEDYAAENGQRYLPSVLEILKDQGLAAQDENALLYTYETYENGDTVTKSAYIDPPITDLAVCEGYNSLAVYAYTVDMDQNLSTNADTELFIQVYDFLNHKTYHPIRLTDDEYSQARPKLVRSDDSTYLFWLENDCAVRYIDVSELIRDYVDADGNIVDTYYLDQNDNIYYQDKAGIYTIRGEGRAYAADDATIYYHTARNAEEIDADDETVRDFYYIGSSGERIYVDQDDLFRDGGLLKCSYELTPGIVSPTVTTDDIKPAVNDYQAVMDNDKNIYILWTQTVVNEDPDANPCAVPANEVFASAMIRENNAASWSNPYQLTHSGNQLDGVSGAVSSNGQLFLACNSFEMKYIGDTEEFLRTAHLNEDGTLSGNPYSIGGIDLMVTRLNEIGCMKASSIEISDMTPTAGETVSVTACIENAGLTAAKQGYTADFYEVRNGVRSDQITSFSSSAVIAANGSATVTFDWTVPEDFDGMTIMAVVRENGYNNVNTAESDALLCAPDYSVTVDNVSQQGDSFVATYTVTNNGNAPTKAGDRIELRFDGLYQSYERYGLDTNILKSLALETLQPGESRTISTAFTVPMVAFDFIGYDQLDVVILNADDETYCAGAGDLVLREPISMTMNGGEALTLRAGSTQALNVDLGNRWLSRLNTVTYSVADESVATVDAAGTLTAVGAGETTVTAIVLPAGTETTAVVTVEGGSGGSSSGGSSGGGSIKDDPTAGSNAYKDPTAVTTPTTPETPVTPANPDTGDGTFIDVPADAYYAGPVDWAVENAVTNGTSATTFSPDMTCTRAQTVTFLWRAAGSPAAENAENPFEDVMEGAYYYDAVLWAVENGITNGTSETTFSPDDTVTRGQTVTFLWRAAEQPEAAAANPFADVAETDYFCSAVLWAVENGITNGTSETTFSPADGCTRAQIVTFLYRSAAVN